MLNNKAQHPNVAGFSTHLIQAGIGPLDPEFCRVADLQRLFGIRRGVAYQLISDGTIRSASLRKKGSTKGCRLVNVQSVRDYLARMMEERGQ